MVSKKPDEIRRLVGMVSEAIQLQVLIDAQASSESERGRIRLKSENDSPSVSVHLTTSPFTAIASLVPDSFSGVYLRFVRDSLPAVRESWSSTLENLEALGTRLAISINGTSRSAADLDVEDWSEVEFEASTRIGSPPTEDARVTALAKSAISVLSLFVACEDALEISVKGEQLGEQEGAPVVRESIRYERSRMNRLRCLQAHGHSCVVCGFNFENFYGEIGMGFIEVHHLFAVSAMPPGYRPDPVKEMVPLCANCHRMVHRRVPPIPPHELKVAGTKLL